MSWPNRTAAWADILVEELARSGVREACLAPGSRSAPLVLAMARHPRIRTFVHLDERSAAFFALGIGKAAGRPAAVLTTSGTAAANLLPAVVEADQGEAPLLLLTADRPHRLRGQDANQTIDQVKLYGDRVRLFHDVALPRAEEPWIRYLRALPARALAAALGPPAGPVHLNLPFEKPLEPAEVPGDVPPELDRAAATSRRPEERPFTEVRRTWPTPDAEALEELAALVREFPRGLLVCGPAAEPGRLGPAALRLAGAAGYPLLADPLSGARFAPGAGSLALSSYDLVLRDGAARRALAPELVIRTGMAGPSASLERFLEERAGETQVVVDAGGRWKDHAAVASRYLRADPAETFARLADRLEEGGHGPAAAAAPWVAAWRRAEAGARAAVEEQMEAGFFEGTAVADVAALLPAGSTLFIGNSMPVRDLESFAAPRDDRLHALGNRGASGIDGTVSTAFGAAAASPGPTVAILGDLALYHDMNGLIAARRFGIDVCFVILNNDGGGIFHLLPIREFEPPFTSHFVAPHGLDFRHAARLYDLPWERAEGRGELRAALERALAEGGPRIVEVPSDAAENRRRHEEVAEAVRRAVGGILDAAS